MFVINSAVRCWEIDGKGGWKTLNLYIWEFIRHIHLPKGLLCSRLLFINCTIWGFLRLPLQTAQICLAEKLFPNMLLMKALNRLWDVSFCCEMRILTIWCVRKAKSRNRIKLFFWLWMPKDTAILWSLWNGFIWTIRKKAGLRSWLCKTWRILMRVW